MWEQILLRISYIHRCKVSINADITSHCVAITFEIMQVARNMVLRSVKTHTYSIFCISAACHYYLMVTTQ